MLKQVKAIAVLSQLPYYAINPPLQHWQYNNAQCSIWHNADLDNYFKQKTALLGHFQAQDESGIALLQSLEIALIQQGFENIIGPINGSTWFSYRLVSQTYNQPPFFLEPQNPPAYLNYFQQSNFIPLAYYHSSISEDFSMDQSKLLKVKNKFKDIAIQNLDLTQWDKILIDIYQLSSISFSKNYLYTPIDKNTFIALYQGIKQYLQPDFVFLAYQNDKLIGYLFAIPDYLQKKSNTIILKTLAILPDRAYAGLGYYLIACLLEKVQERGIKKIIYALIHNANVSSGLAAQYGGKVIREYSLLRKTLISGSQ